MNRDQKLERLTSSVEYQYFMSFARMQHLDEELADDLIRHLTDELKDPDDRYIQHEPIVDRISKRLAEHIELASA